MSNLKKSWNFSMSNLKNTFPGSPEIGTASWWHVDPYVYTYISLSIYLYTSKYIYIYIRFGSEYPAVPGGGSFIRCKAYRSLGKRWVNLIPVAQQTINNNLTNGDVEEGRIWVLGREFKFLQRP